MVGLTAGALANTQKVHAHEGADKFYFVLEGEVSSQLDEEKNATAGSLCGCARQEFHTESPTKLTNVYRCSSPLLHRSNEFTQNQSPKKLHSSYRKRAARPVARITQLVTENFSTVSTRPVFPELRRPNYRRAGQFLPLDATPLDQLIADCQTLIENSRHNGHPRFFGYVASPATAPGAFGDLLASALNINVTSWRSGPAATEIERTVIE